MTESSNKIDDLDEAVPTPARTKNEVRSPGLFESFFLYSLLWSGWFIAFVIVFVMVKVIFVNSAEPSNKECVEAQDEIRDLLGQAPDGDTAISDTLTADLKRLNLELRNVCSYNETVVFEVEEVFPWFGETPPSTDSPAPTDTES